MKTSYRPWPYVFVRKCAVVLVALSFGVFVAIARPLAAADRHEIDSFLDVTGFGIALDSIALSAESAPAMIGLEADHYGSAWDAVASEVFDLAILRDMAMTLLQNTLSDMALRHASAFYGSDLGRRLVQAENATHDIVDQLTVQEAGERIVAQLVAQGDARVALYRRLARAIDVEGTAVQAVQEIQFRFMMAAADSGLVELNLAPDELRTLLKDTEGALNISMLRASLASAAYTYQGFSVEEVTTYVQALESPMMQEVYALLNAVQFELQANRYVELAYRLASLQPLQDL